MKVTFETEDCDAMYIELARVLDTGARKGIPIAIGMSILQSLIDVMKNHATNSNQTVEESYPPQQGVTLKVVPSAGAGESNA